MLQTLKLIVLYNARTNEYTVSDHNLTLEEAERQLATYRAQDLQAIAVEQRARHQSTDPQACRACRNNVARALGLGSKPQFQRRRPHGGEEA